MGNERNGTTVYSRSGRRVATGLPVITRLRVTVYEQYSINPDVLMLVHFLVALYSGHQLEFIYYLIISQYYFNTNHQTTELSCDKSQIYGQQSSLRDSPSGQIDGFPSAKMR